MDELFPWAVVLSSGLICYGWRALGVTLSHSLDPDGALARWLTCVSYAMLAAVVARMIILPSGALAASTDLVRYGACAVALGVFLALRRGVLAGTAAGFLALLAFNLWGGAFAAAG